MMHIKSFTFNPFAENTYLLYADSGEACLIDPGCSSPQEQNELLTFIKGLNLQVSSIVLTHAHIDHILGNKWANDTFNLKTRAHPMEQKVFQSGIEVARMYGLSYEAGVEPTYDLKSGSPILLAGEEWEIRDAPGHSPGSIVFINHQNKWVISGDVLFFESIGRSDLPGGDQSTLLKSITNALYSLEDEFLVYPGHGSMTSIGYEKKFNPYVRA